MKLASKTSIANDVNQIKLASKISIASKTSSINLFIM